VFHGLFQGLLRRLLLRLKFNGHVTLARPLGLLLARHPDCAKLSVDCVIPVPLHRSRLARRGYNQALELAKPLAAALHLPCESRLLERIRATAPQTGENLALRQRNTRGAFSASSHVRGIRILLLDDIVTTGATMEAAANALLEAGAKGVSVAAVGRTARIGQSA
jgi:ComF family protein